MRVSKLTAVIALLSLTACSHQQAFIVTAESINAAGEQFVIVHDYMEEAAKTGAVSPQSYAKWRNFGLKFQAAFHLAVDLFKISMLADDLVMKEQAVAMIVSLLPELLKFAEDAGLVLVELK